MYVCVQQVLTFLGIGAFSGNRIIKQKRKKRTTHTVVVVVETVVRSITVVVKSSKVAHEISKVCLCVWLFCGRKQVCLV